MDSAAKEIAATAVAPAVVTSVSTISLWYYLVDSPKESLSQLFLPVDTVDGTMRLRTIGSGRFATVFLAFVSDDVDTLPRAVKFLRDGFSSAAEKSNAELRFRDELGANMRIYQGIKSALPAYKGCGLVAGGTSNKCLQSASLPQETVVAMLKKNQSAAAQLQSQGFSPQGAFFVMAAEAMSLADIFEEDVLLKELVTLKSDCSIGSSIHSLCKQKLRISRYENAIAALKQQKPTTGFDILSKLPDAAASTAVCLEVCKQVANHLKSLHQVQRADTNTGWCHRDVKPANLLVNGDLNVLLTDLGFVANRSQVTGNLSIFGSPQDAGGLALGSPMFQAPEQAENRLDASVRVESSTSLIARVGSEISISPGEFLYECSLFVSSGDPVKILDAKRIDSTPGAYRVTIAADGTLQPGTRSRALLVRPIGHAADIYALGAILYYLLSLGKNPQKFFIRHLQRSEFDKNSSLEICKALGVGTRDNLDAAILRRVSNSRYLFWPSMLGYRQPETLDVNGRPIPMGPLCLAVRLMSRTCSDAFVKEADVKRGGILDDPTLGDICNLVDEINILFDAKRGLWSIQSLSEFICARLLVE